VAALVGFWATKRIIDYLTYWISSPRWDRGLDRGHRHELEVALEHGIAAAWECVWVRQARHQSQRATGLAPVVECGKGQVVLRRRWERHALAGDGDEVLWLALASRRDRYGQRSEGSKKSNRQLEEHHFRQRRDMVVAVGNQGGPASGCLLGVLEGK
jgi:hypothetical protein